MASVCCDPGGRKRILFVDPDGCRKAIRMGKASKGDAVSLKVRVEQLLSAQITGGMDRDLSLCVAGLHPDLREKLERVGLLEAAKPLTVTRLEAFITSYIDGRADLKPSTLLVRHQVRTLLVDRFGADRDVTTITAGDADDFQQWLIGKKMAPATISKRIQVAKSFFRAMVRHEIIIRNPFDGIRATAASNAERMRFVTREDIELVLAKCPDHHWKAIVALCRYGGLRCPSEVLSLRWQDIDWHAGRIVVTSPKTEHHAGGHRRVMPLFPELRPFLAESFELAPDGAVYVVDERYRRAAMGAGGWANANLRTTLTKIVAQAGLTPWPKLFQNLRASRETELAERFPIQVVTSWLGNSPKVAMKHYLMTTDEHFAKAMLDTETGAAKAAQKAAHSDPKMAQNAAQQGPEATTHANEETPRNTDENVGFAMPIGVIQIAETGLEPVTTGL